jgi:hypothetical protein
MPLGVRSNRGIPASRDAPWMPRDGRLSAAQLSQNPAYVEQIVAPNVLPPAHSWIPTTARVNPPYASPIDTATFGTAISRTPTK